MKAGRVPVYGWVGSEAAGQELHARRTRSAGELARRLAALLYNKPNTHLSFRR
jgi:hypothetical protein